MRSPVLSRCNRKADLLRRILISNKLFLLAFQLRAAMCAGCDMALHEPCQGGMHVAAETADRAAKPATHSTASYACTLLLFIIMAYPSSPLKRTRCSSLESVGFAATIALWRVWVVVRAAATVWTSQSTLAFCWTVLSPPTLSIRYIDTHRSMHYYWFAFKV